MLRGKEGTEKSNLQRKTPAWFVPAGLFLRRSLESEFTTGFLHQFKISFGHEFS